MTWDATQPTNTTKIRNLGVVIRPNWQAIETADSSFKPRALNLNNRTVLGVSVDPAAIANAYLLYCKTDGAGNSELYGINPSSNVIQLTKGAPTVAAIGSTFLPGGAILKWGNLGINNGSNNASTLFVTPFPNACWGVVVTPVASTSTANNAGGVSVFNVNGFTCFRGFTSGICTYSYFAIGS